DWVAVLRSGPAGVQKWNRLTAGQRQLTKLGRGDYSGCDLSGVNFRGQSVLPFKAAGATLTGARLGGGSFVGGDFRNADLSGADMCSFGGREADFSGARLIRADLPGGWLVRAKLVGADLTGADLTDADLTAADLTGAVLTDANLAGARFTQQTKWPAGFAVPG